MSYISIFIISFVLSLLFTPIVRRAMLKLGIVDHPCEDRWNAKSVALLGGTAIFISFTLSVLLIIGLTRESFVLLLGGGMIFVLGLLDDLVGTHPRVKLAVQVLIAFGVIYLGVVSKFLPYSWLNIFLTVFWIVGLMNAVNLLDNMDGLSSGITIIAALAILGLSLQKGEAGVALLCLALAGTCLGFLRYNSSPAKIFMGDCGSMFLGYMLAALAVLGGWQHSSPLAGTLLPPILILGVPIFDTTLVTVLRLKNGRWPWQGGKDHSSHRLVSILDGNEKAAVLVLYGVGILSGVLALVTTKLDSLMAVLIAVVFFLGMIILGIGLAKVGCYGAENGPQINAGAEGLTAD